MKNRKTFISLLLLFTLLISAVGPAAVQAAPGDRVGYVLTGSESGGEFVVDVYISNVNALVGKLAISFDSEKLQLKDTSSLSRAVQNTSDVVVTTEGLDPSVLLSNEKGYAMFAWYAEGYSAIDATSSDVKIASIVFEYKNGASPDDFSRNTFGLHYVNETMADKWDCSANIIADGLISYRNTAIEDEYLCGVSFDYPNCDYIPPVTYEAGVKVSDTSGRAMSGASVTVGLLEAKTDSSGYVSFEMEDGVYPYRVSLFGYETKNGYIIIDGSAAQISAQLKSYSELVLELAANLSIIYSAGDNESSVTTSVGLPETGSYGETITWQSSNESVVSSAGIVNRLDDDTRVSLTATITYGGATTKRTFDIIVKGRISAEEKNAAIVQSDTAALTIGYAPGDNADSVTTGLLLPEMGEKGSAIAWQSSNEEVISPFGAVVRPEYNTAVTLTARIMRGTAAQTKEFTVTVIGMSNAAAMTDSEIVDKVIAALEITYAEGDSAQRVTQSLTLPLYGVEDTIINWTSSHPAVVTAYGGVVRQTQDYTVTLTATAEKGTASKQKTFTVVVPAAEQIPVNPDNGQEEDINNSNAVSRPSGIPVGGSSGNLPGNTSDNTSTDVPTEKPTDTPDASGKGFTDISDVPWANEAILALAERGVIKGTSESTYSPNDSILRRDFVTLLMRMLNLDGEIEGEAFADVPEGEYYYEPIMLAKSLGLITGVGDNKFDPDGNISRQDMMTITYRVLEKLDKADLEAADLSEFGDYDSVADYAYESVSKMVGGGYIQGDDERKLNPTSDTTRAETAVFLYRLEI